MSKSQIACAIDTRESAIVRLKTSGSESFSLNACKTFPVGSDTLASGKGARLLKKISDQIGKWQEEELALSLEPATLLPLPTLWPAGASPEAAREYSRIEAGYFLNRPEEYLCDIAGFTVNANTGGPLAKQLLLFYPAEPCRMAREHFSVTHRIVFSCSSQLPLLHLSKLTGKTQVILKLEENHLIFVVARDGQVEKFSCRQVKNRQEAEYFSIREIIENPICRETGVQVTGKWADSKMIKLIGKETSATLQPLGIPPSIAISNPNKFRISSPAAVKAISTALMALANQS
jgi:hypothetical protein